MTPGDFAQVHLDLRPGLDAGNATQRGDWKTSRRSWDQTAQAISTEQYLNAREQAALQGQVYNPHVGFALLGNVSNHPSYIYNPYYGEWSPRLAGAWDVFGDGRTVIRGGYGLTYGRLNGVDLVLVPLWDKA